MEFDQMQSTADNGNDYDFDDFDTVEFPDMGDSKTVVGELLSVVEEVGKYDSTVYLLESEEGERLMVWGNAGIDNGYEAAVESGLEIGDWVGIRQTGETYENQYGEFKSFEFRFQSA